MIMIGMSLAGNRHNNVACEKGFTLIEVLVTLFLLALLAGVASTAIDLSGERNARYEVKSVANLINALRDEAESTGRSFGLMIDDATYSVVEFDAEQGKWREIKNDRLGFTRTIHGSFVFEEGESGGWWSQQKRTIRKDFPQIAIYSSGEMTPFRLGYVLSQQTEPLFYIVSDGMSDSTWDIAR